MLEKHPCFQFNLYSQYNTFPGRVAHGQYERYSNLWQLFPIGSPWGFYFNRASGVYLTSWDRILGIRAATFIS